MGPSTSIQDEHVPRPAKRVTLDGSAAPLRPEPGVVRHFFSAYPRRTGLMIVLMIGAGLAEGVGVLTLVPIVQLADTGSSEPGRLTGLVDAMLGAVGLEPTLPTLLALVVLAVWVKAVLLFFAQRHVGFTVSAVVRDLRLDLLRSLLEARWSYFVRSAPGQFANAVAREARRSALAYREACAALAALFQMLAYMAVALALSWMIAIAAAATGLLLTAAGGRFFAMSRDSGVRSTSSSRALSARLVDVLQGVKPLKAMGREDLVWPFLEQETESLNLAGRQEVVAQQALLSLHEPILVVVLVAGLYVLLELSGLPLSEALVMAFVFYRLVGHVGTLQQRYQGILGGEASFLAFRRELTEARAHREDWPGHGACHGVENAIRLEGVGFDYDGRPVLDGVDATLQARSVTAIHGASGSGKTTLADLLAGLLRPGSGRILVDGVPLEEIDLRAWRRSLGYVPQEPLLVNGSILDNVSLGDPRHTREDVESALRMAGAWSFVCGRERGMDEWIGDRGAMLSGGQRQRIALARALVGKPSLLLLDEVTTGLDPATEARIVETIRSLGSSMTIVSISHQKALRDIADHVLVLTDGRLAAA